MTCGTMTSAAVSLGHGMWNLRFSRELQLLDASPGHAGYHVVQIYTTGRLRALFTVCSWLTSVEWAKWEAGKKVWDASKSEVHSPQPVKSALPSDSRFREDLKALLVRLTTRPSFNA